MPKVALVASDPDERIALARTFDAAPADWVLTLSEAAPDDADVVVAAAGARLEDAVFVHPNDPERALRDVAERLSERQGRQVVWFVSASGGTGTTSIALHVAAAFARRRRPTCVVDADPSWGMAARLGLTPEALGADPVPVPGGFRVVRPRGVAVADVVAAMSRQFARVVVDAGAAATAAPAATGASILVVAPTPQGARRARALLDHDEGWMPTIVANRTGPGGETTTAQVARILERPVALELPVCAALRDAEDDDRLLAPGWWRWVRGVERLAAALDR